MDILAAIGSTSIVRLHRVVPPGCADILVKREWANPTGSVKGRMAQRVIEYTGGSTGTSLAPACAAKGYPVHIVTSDAFSKETLDQMAALAPISRSCQVRVGGRRRS